MRCFFLRKINCFTINDLKRLRHGSASSRLATGGARHRSVHTPGLGRIWTQITVEPHHGAYGAAGLLRIGRAPRCSWASPGTMTAICNAAFTLGLPMSAVFGLSAVLVVKALLVERGK